MFNVNQIFFKKTLFLTADPFAYFDFNPFDCDQGSHNRQGRKYKFAHDKFFVFSLTIATTLYKYMHIYLWTDLRIVVFERGIWGGDFFIFNRGERRER